jgi:AcrR family transcriptional regulator
MARSGDPKAADFSLIGEFIPDKPTKSSRTRLRILEAAIHCIASRGFEAATFDAIAKKARASRPLVQVYFPEKEGLFLLAVRLVRARYQNYVIEKMANETDPLKTMRTYLRAQFEWTRLNPLPQKLWTLFLARATQNAEYRKIHTDIVDIGHDRITALIEAGVASGTFKVQSPRETAKLIQTLLTGAHVVLVTEDPSPRTRNLETWVIEECLRLLGARPSR